MGSTDFPKVAPAFLSDIRRCLRVDYGVGEWMGKHRGGMGS